MSDPVGKAKAEYRAARVQAERQTEHARQALANEAHGFALIHLEAATVAAERAKRAKTTLDKAVKRAANAVPYA